MLNRRLADVAQGASGWTFWETSVPAASGDTAAALYVRREAERPLHCAQRLRVVLVRYSEGDGALVLVADRAALSRTDLSRTANALATGTEQRITPRTPVRQDPPAVTTTVPPWGLGEPDNPDFVDPIPFALAAGPPLVVSRLALAAAVVLSRYESDESPRVGVLDPDGGPDGLETTYVHEVDLSPVEGEQSAAFLNRVAYTLSGVGTPTVEAPGTARPSVGVVLGKAVEGEVYRPCLSPYFPLTLHAERQPDGSVLGSCLYDPALVAPTVAEAFTRGVARVAAQLAAGGEDTGAINVAPMGTAEASHIAVLGTTPARTPAPDPTADIHDRFREMVRAQPDAVAVSGADTELTYRRLDDLADDMATALRGLGAGPGRTVGVCLERDPMLVVTLLAVLKAGCAYVPMDTRYPEERLRYVTAHAGVSVVVTDLPDFPDVEGVKCVGPQELLRLAATAPHGTDPSPRGDRDAPAYVIYTSGSTGRPKGVVVPHRNVLALVDATEDDFWLGPRDVWTMFHSSAFDFSVWEIWGCLLTGGRLVVVPYWITRDTERFHQLLAEQQVTVLNQTPSAFGQVMAADQDSDARLAVRLIIFGGEPLDTRMLLPWFTRYPPASCRLVNMFGITETTVHVTAETITPESALHGSRCVGRPLPGWSVTVRDGRGQVLPVGAAGEICVGGAGVSDGYLGQPELTAERFVRDPATRERIYRSGDKGRILPDGRLEHLGRIDNQVKLRGFRIELDEIRHVLLSSADVLAAAVVLDPGDRDDPTAARIDAYAVLRAGASRAEVLSHARRTLPDYMVPTTLTPVDAIPLTINGKLDASRLPAPGSGAGVPVRGGERSAPAGGQAADPLEKTVLDLWRRRLGTEVGVQDNFFELGGNSLLVVRLIAELKDLGLPKVSVQEFYGNSTAGRFIELVRRRSSEPTTSDATKGRTG
ncbi:non-ribosomal peptide synthetase [Streptomyces sp. NBC_00158]|uniref:non-ribosomal peptide synthetase n=1 Tax=Streptomyces sp. NBC_00158 TaxID=2903627 RepID=UPI00324C5C3A